MEGGYGGFVIGQDFHPDGDPRTAGGEGHEIGLEGKDGEGGHGLFALFSVGVVWVKDGLFFGGNWIALERVFLKEAGLETGVAGASGLFDFEQEGVAITIGIPAEDFLGMAAGFSFQPVFLTGSAPVVHEAVFQCGGEGGLVHPSHHEDPFGVGVLDDGWDESVGVVFEFGLHGRGLVGRGRSLGDGLGEGKSGRGGASESRVERGFWVWGDGMKKGGGAGEGWAVCWGYE